MSATGTEHVNTGNVKKMMTEEKGLRALRRNMGLGDTLAALPVANGGTGASTTQRDDDVLRYVKTGSPLKGGEFMVASNLRAVYREITERLPSSVTFTTKKQPLTGTNPATVNFESANGDTGLAVLSDGAISIKKGASYSILANLNMDVYPSQGYGSHSYTLYAVVDGTEFAMRSESAPDGHWVSFTGQELIDLGNLKAGSTVKFWIKGQYMSGTGDSGSRFTLKKEF